MKYYLVAEFTRWERNKAEWYVYSVLTPPIIEVDAGGYVYVDGEKEVVARVETKEMAIKIATLLTQDEKENDV